MYNEKYVGREEKNEHIQQRLQAGAGTEYRIVYDTTVVIKECISSRRRRRRRRQQEIIDTRQIISIRGLRRSFDSNYS